MEVRTVKKKQESCGNAGEAHIVTAGAPPFADIPMCDEPASAEKRKSYAQPVKYPAKPATGE